MNPSDLACGDEAPESFESSILIYLISSDTEVSKRENPKDAKKPEVWLEEMASEIEQMDPRFCGAIRIVVERTTAEDHLTCLARGRLLRAAREKEIDLVIGCWMKEDLTQEVFSLEHQLWRKVRGHGTHIAFIPPKLDVAGWLKHVRKHIFRFLGAPNSGRHQPTPTLLAK